MDKLFYSIYCSEVVHSFGVENDPNSEEIYELFYKTLEAVSKSENKVQLLLSVIKFQLKITHIAGYSLELEPAPAAAERSITTTFISLLKAAEQSVKNAKNTR